MPYDYLYGPVQMRADKHRLIQPLFIGSVAKVNGKDVNYYAEGTGYGWKTDLRLDAAQASLPHYLPDGGAALAETSITNHWKRGLL